MQILILIFALSQLVNGWAKRSPSEPDYCSLSGSVFVETSAGLADYRVYIEDSEGLANMSVYKEDNRMFADKPGRWHFINSRGLADFKICYVETPGLADFTIYFTDTEAFAGCR